MALSFQVIILMKRIFLVSFLVMGICANTYPELSKKQIKQDFYWAETFVLFEEYNEALPLYQELLQADPQNANYKYRSGQCLINIEGRKHEAIPYLESAVHEINPRYKEGKLKEKGAPYDAYYYLANAYRINNQLEKAISTYEIFRKNLDPKIYDTTIVDHQIESCRNAIEVMKDPLYVKKVNLGGTINDQYADINPVISADQNIMVYNRQTPFQEALFFTRKINGQWTEPRNIIPDLGLGQEEANYATSLSDDGSELYIYRQEQDYDGNIYVTRRQPDDTWTNLKKLNENINTKYWESHATISHDGKKLYFTSNRKGTYGGLDIYVSERDSADAWEEAVNLGPTINTEYNEESPFLGKDEKTLFFSSRGHYNIGGYDIFYSTLQDSGRWSTPLNVGYPVNTTDDDVFFNPLDEGYQALYSMIDSGGYGLSDIYRIEIFSVDHPRKFLIKGVARIKDLMPLFSDSVKILAMNINNHDAKVTAYSNPVTGEYQFRLPQGTYTLTYEANNAETEVKRLDIPINHPSDDLVIPSIILPKTDFEAELYVGDNLSVTVTSGDSISFPLRVEPYSVLSIQHWSGNSLISTERFVISDSSFNYKMSPLPGENKLIFSLTDRLSNNARSQIMVYRKRIIARQPVAKPEYTEEIMEEETKTDTVTTETEETPVAAIPAEPSVPVREKSNLLLLWIVLGAGLLLFAIIYVRRKTKNKKEENS